MEQMYVLGALGAVILGLAGWGLLDNGNGGDDDDDDETGRETGIEIEFDGSDELIGTNRDDTLLADQDDTLAPDSIELRGGDDKAEIENPLGISVFGGRGDDTLVSNGGNVLWGGAGDDILTGDDGDRLIGQDGNDTINLDLFTRSTEDDTRVDGGDGDDVINITGDAGIDWIAGGETIIRGGAGLDTFNVKLNVKDSDIALEGEGGGTFITDWGKIDDFNPAEDKLNVDILRATADRPYSVEFAQVEKDGGFVTDVTFTFAKTDLAAEAVSTLRVVSTAAFGVDAINFTDTPTDVVTIDKNPVNFDGTETLTGTTQDDTILGGQNADLAPEKIFLGKGDDDAVIDTAPGIFVQGGQGNDDLTSTVADTKFSGGEGNDILNGISSNRLSGDDGDDEINLTLFDNIDAPETGEAAATAVDGGDGNDEITVMSDTALGSVNELTITAIDGGAGQDIFNFDIAAKDSDAEHEVVLAKITDFAAAEDTLNINVTPGANGEAAREFTFEFKSSDPVVDEETGETTYRADVVINFAATATSAASTSVVRVLSDGPITQDIVNFTGLTPVVPAA